MVWRCIQWVCDLVCGGITSHSLSLYLPLCLCGCIIDFLWSLTIFMVWFIKFPYDILVGKGYTEFSYWLALSLDTGLEKDLSSETMSALCCVFIRDRSTHVEEQFGIVFPIFGGRQGRWGRGEQTSYVNEENNVHSNVMSDLPLKKRVSDFLATLVDNKVGREFRGATWHFSFELCLKSINCS